MGNRTSVSTSPKLGMVALARSMPLSKNQLAELMKECIVITCGCHFQSFTIDRESFRRALTDTVPKLKDAEILDLLFTMWDLQGNHFIQYREFLVGISPLGCDRRDSIVDILRFSLALMDTAKSGFITQYNLTKVLRAINATASYLGDKVLRNSEIDEIVRGVYRTSVVKSLKHEDVVLRLVMHPKVQKFTEGRGTYRYRPPAPKDLEEYQARISMISKEHSGMGLRLSGTTLYEC